MSASAPNNVDLDALLDLTEYDGVSNFQSPSVSPTSISKPTFASPVTAAVSTPSVPTTTQALSGPSHNYDMYRQQTGFVPGAIANTMAVNQTNNTGYQDFASLDYLSGFNENEVFDFNTSPSQATMNEMEMDFDSPANSQMFTVNPSSIEQEALPSPPVLPTQSNNVGRLWPGAHQQAAMAKAQAQQRQQQQLIQQQQAAQRQGMQPKPRGKSAQPTDPIVEQKITQLLNSMRAKPSMPEQAQTPMTNLPRSKKEEEEMDEDERLLASEEGKKLSSKERRQLRNKVSARAFRSRRKEYISQLESEIANKVNENGDLRAQNRALMEENKRLSDLTRMLLSSPSFSGFLDTLSSDPNANQTPQMKVEPMQQQEQRQMPKDVNPYNAQQSSQQQIGMAMIPEQTMDFSMLTLDNTYSFQPQVFMVDTPEAAIDTSILSGKTSNFVEPIESDDEKVEIPVIERLVEKAEAAEPTEVAPLDEEFESDPEFALYHSEPTASQEPKELDTESLSHVDIFGGIESEKILARYELLDATEEEAVATVSMARVQRISAHIDSVVSRLELLTMDL